MAAGERVLVVGAGPCGLAIARQLRHDQGIDALVVDRADAPAASWRRIYEGFRLNTCGYWSHLPGQTIPRRCGRWPRRDDLVSYFDDYVRRQELRVAFGENVIRIDPDGERWQVTTDGETRFAAAVVVATGNYHTPAIPPWPGMDGFTGGVLHSADYRSPLPLRGRDVLVVGSGNSAVDIVLQLSAGAGADAVAGRVRMSVRTPPHLVPRSAAGIPVDAFSPLFDGLPVPVLDHAGALLRRVWFRDATAAGLPAPEQGMYTALRNDRKVPTLGDELVPRIREGSVEVVAAVESFDAQRVVLADGRSVTPDVVIAATGYRTGLEPMVGHLGVLDPDGHPEVDGLPGAAPGLWFAGYDEPLIGPLKSFRRQATPIARDVARFLGAAA